MFISSLCVCVVVSLLALFVFFFVCVMRCVFFQSIFLPSARWSRDLRCLVSLDSFLLPLTLSISPPAFCRGFQLKPFDCQNMGVLINKGGMRRHSREVRKKGERERGKGGERNEGKSGEKEGERESSRNHSAFCRFTARSPSSASS